MKSNLVARHDLAHVLAPGLFRSLAPGGRARKKLHVVWKVHGKRITFDGDEPLGVDDLRVLQALVALAGVGGNGRKKIAPAPKTDIGRKLRNDLMIAEASMDDDAIAEQTSWRELAATIGLKNHDNAGRRIAEVLDRLAKVSIVVEEGGRRQGFHLLAWCRADSAVLGVWIALNPLIARAIFGDGRYVHIDMAEVRAIKKDTTRLLFQRLCGVIDFGKSRRFGLDTLSSYLWPDPPATPGAERKRRQRIKAAMDELKSLNWGARFEAGNWLVTRPASKFGQPS